LVFLVAVTQLTACGDGGDDSAAATSNPPSGNPPSGNSAPSISGNPPSQVMAGSPFSFTPTATDPDGDALTFSASNLPVWASIDANSGIVSGTPGQGDVGTYTNIRITVSDGTVSVSTPALSIEVVVLGTGSALLSWVAPSQNSDGSPLLDLDGYRVYWGPAPGSYINSETMDAGVTNYLVEGLTPGTWYFAATAVNSLAIESSFSNVASKTIL
jgi:hypothetical protein